MSEDENYAPWIPRAPRYELTLRDERRLRFADLRTRNEATYAILRNISESGIAFTTSGQDKPDEGDVIKIEFVIPDEKQIACFATVTRVDPGENPDAEWGNQPYHVVALQFRNLPDRARYLITRGIRFKPKIDDEVLEVGKFRFSRSLVVRAGLIALLGLLIAALYVYG